MKRPTLRGAAFSAHLVGLALGQGDGNGTFASVVLIEDQLVHFSCEGVTLTGPHEGVATRTLVGVTPSGGPLVGTVTATLIGPTPGTNTVPPPADCSEICVTTVQITITPPSSPGAGSSSPGVGSPTPGAGSSIPAVESSSPAVGSPTPGAGSSSPAVESSTPAAGGSSSSVITETHIGSTSGTSTVMPSSDCTDICVTTVQVTIIATTPAAGTSGTAPNASNLVTRTTTGPTAGTSTIPPAADCTTSCQTTLLVTVAPIIDPPKPIPSVSATIYSTFSTTGPTAGTSTYPVPDGCTEGCVATVMVTNAPIIDPPKPTPSVGGPSVSGTSYTTFSTTGPTAGTSTYPVPAGCTENCVATVMVTEAPVVDPSPNVSSPSVSGTSYTTFSTTGPTAGTSTYPVPAGCTENCVATVMVTNAPIIDPSKATPSVGGPGVSSTSYTTFSTTGPTAGTSTYPVPDGCTENCVATVMVTNAPIIDPPKPIPSVSGTSYTTFSTTGPTAGTSTYPVPDGCIEGCVATVMVTNAPSATGTSYTTFSTTGPTAGTSTYPVPAGCTEGCVATVMVTNAPSATGTSYTTFSTTGPTAGTSTYPVPDGCTEGCVATVMVTNAPSATGTSYTTFSTTGPTAGTSTYPVPDGCTEGCVATVMVTNAPSATGTSYTTFSTTGPTAGTSTFPVPDGCTDGCVATVMVTVAPSATGTTYVTKSTTGPTAGTSTFPVPDGCSEGCVATVMVTVAPIIDPPKPTPNISATSYVTRSTTGPTAGTSTIPAPDGCTGGCVATVVVTVAPSETDLENRCTPGLRWAYFKCSQSPGGYIGKRQMPYNNDYDIHGSWINSFDPKAILSGESPDRTGSTPSIGFASPGQPVIYGQNIGQLAFSIVQHVGYFHPAMTGTYTFTFNLCIDDGALLWIGKNAKKNWNRSNANMASGYINWKTQPNKANVPSSFTFDAVKGSFVPIRIVYGNAQGGALFSFSIKDPTGKLIASTYSNPSANIEHVLPIQNRQLVFGCPSDSRAKPFAF
ncbi:hypothetical protein RJ55_04776 [Drechmeria coniospora]|nr:hypothetical protein RJ55_04776 [Drechmeria coniospora]